MPQKITMADGTEQEVFLPSEVEDLKTQAGRVTTLETELAEAKKVSEEGVGAGVKNLRDNFKKLKTVLNAQGIEVDEEGNVTKQPEGASKSLSQEDVQKIAQSEAQKLTLNSMIDSSIQSFDKDTQAVIKKRFSQLTQGETVTAENLSEHLSAAIRAAGVNAEVQVQNHYQGGFNGGGPVFKSNEKKQGFSETPEGKAAAASLFGEDNLIK